MWPSYAGCVLACRRCRAFVGAYVATRQFGDRAAVALRLVASFSEAAVARGRRESIGARDEFQTVSNTFVTPRVLTSVTFPR